MIKKLAKMPSQTFSAWLEIAYRPRFARLPNGSYYLRRKVPFFAKWESPGLVEQIRDGMISAQEDPLWKNSGATDPHEYESYSWQICAMACLKMVLATMNPKKNYPLVSIAKEAEQYGVYKKNGHPDIRKNLDGMFHAPFLEFTKTLGLDGFRRTSAGTHQICRHITRQIFVLASVTEDFAATRPEEKGGHLVVVVGFEVKNQMISGFYVNNPSGKNKKNQEYSWVDIDTWKKNFSGNIICLRPESYKSSEKPE